ncbi:hypothetical protein [Campylobacter sp. 7477a]|uniref:hypothetical protein n=1 Tax=Campylobacter sp. 7477a TaxID=2735741 RepID=UPI0030145CAB|nr:hypothetical protein [Campylobacter sp. 7477a]
MKKAVLFLCLLGAFSFAFSGSFTSGYITKKGKYVAPHFKSNRDGTMKNNYSTKGNRNPYTGKKGTKKRRSSKF